MKKLALGILVAVTILAVSGVVVALARAVPAVDKVNEKAKAPDLEKIEFIHWKKGFAKPVCGDGEIHKREECGEPGLSECPAGEVCINCKCVDEEEEEPAPTGACYAFLGQYGPRLLEWKDKDLPVSYMINPENPDGLSETLVTSAISAGAEEWDYWTGAELFDDSYGIDYTATYGVLDHVNAISFQDYYSDPDIIAAATVWYNPATKAIVEFDIVFETNHTWGDAGPTNETELGKTSVMDLQNIATHELGHGVGLADIYNETECAEVTMYGYSTEGETKKRTLAGPDITGIQALYGE